MTPRNLRDLPGAPLTSPLPPPRKRPVAHVGALCAFSLCLAAGVLLSPEAARAACDPDSPPLVDGGSVTCTGTDDGFDASGATDVTIITSGTTTLDESGALNAAILISDDNTVTIGADTTITVTEANGAGVRGGDRNTVRNEGTIIVNESDGVAIDVGSIPVPDPVPDTPITNAGTITLNGANAVGIRTVDNYTVTNEAAGTITLGAGATGGTAILGEDDNIVTSDGTITIDATNAFGIRINDNTGVALPNGAVFGAGSTTTVNGDGSTAMSVRDSVGTAYSGTIDLIGNDTIGVDIRNKIDPTDRANHTNDTSGIINVMGNDSIGIRAGNGWVGGFNNFGTFVPDERNIRNFGTINVDGLSSIAIQVGNDSSVRNTGTINLTGDMTVGIDIGDKLDEFGFATSSNDSGGTINVMGDDAFGIRAGDGWIGDDNGVAPFTPNVLAIRNFGAIDVTGDRSTGAFLGDPTNLAGNNNSYFVNGDTATLSVTGVGAIGISIGGNDQLDPWSVDDASLNVSAFSVGNAGDITGGPDAGPLIEFRTTLTGSENRLLNVAGGSIVADLTNQNGVDRGVAILGSNGRDTIINLGEIAGDVLLMGGDDLYLVNDTFDQSAGRVFGGGGTDEFALGFVTPTTPVEFDASILDGFERLRIEGRNSTTGDTVGWTLINTAGFTGTAAIAPTGRLVVPAPGGTTTPLALGGNFEVDPLGSLALTPDGVSVPLTVQGDATLDGELIVDLSLIEGTPGAYRLIQVNGPNPLATEFATDNIPPNVGTFLTSTSYLTDGLELIIARGTFAAVATSANRASIGATFDEIFLDGSSPPALQQVINALESTGNVNNVFDAVSPEPYDAQTTILAESQRQIAHLLLDRPRDCRAGEFDPWQASRAPLRCHRRALSAWATTYGSFRTRDAFKDHRKYDADSYGVLLGVDLAPIGDLELTIAAGGQRSQVDVAAAGESDLVLATLSGLASYESGPFRVQGVANYLFGSHEDRRDFAFNETGSLVSGRTIDEHESHTVGLSGQMGYVFKLGGVSLEPIAGFDYAWISQGEISEQGGSVWNLDIDERDDSILSFRGGFQLSTIYHHTAYISEDLLFLDGIWRPTLDLGWRQTVIGYEREIDARLSSTPTNISGFTVEGEEDRNGIEFGAGLSFVPDNANRLQFDLRYEGYRGSSTLDHDLVAKVRFGF